MARVLFWTPRALSEYDKLVEYLYDEWSEEITKRVITEIGNTLLRIQAAPEHYPIYVKRGKVRRCVASPQTSIFFIVKNEHIEIFSIFDNRQHPNKRKL